MLEISSACSRRPARSAGTNSSSRIWKNSTAGPVRIDDHLVLERARIEVADPELVADVVLAPQRLAALDQVRHRRRVGGSLELQDEQVRLDDVLGRRQDVGDDVLALDDPLVDGAVHLDRVDHADREHRERREGGDEDTQ